MWSHVNTFCRTAILQFRVVHGDVCSARIGSSVGNPQSEESCHPGRTLETLALRSCCRLLARALEGPVVILDPAGPSLGLRWLVWQKLNLKT